MRGAIKYAAPCHKQEAGRVKLVSAKTFKMTDPAPWRIPPGAAYLAPLETSLLLDSVNPLVERVVTGLLSTQFVNSCFRLEDLIKSFLKSRTFPFPWAVFVYACSSWYFDESCCLGGHFEGWLQFVAASSRETAFVSSYFIV